jgi:ankyrin repeat protein
MQRETGLHWAAFGGHADIVDLLLRANAPVNMKDKRFDGTPLGWAIYGWSNPAPESRETLYYEVVERLVCAGAVVDREWLDSPNRGSSLGKKLRGDPRMLATLRVEK